MFSTISSAAADTLAAAAWEALEAAPMEAERRVMRGVSSGADTSSTTARGQERVKRTMMMPMVSKALRMPRAPSSLATVLCAARAGRGRGRGAG